MVAIPADVKLALEDQKQREEQEKNRRLERLLRAIDDAESASYGSDVDGQLAKERGLSIDFFLGKNVEPSPEGRSQVNDRSVFETIQWVLPSLLRIYASGGNVVEFQPLGPDDEESAEQESDYLNYVVTQKNRWFDILAVLFQDALLTKNAYCLAYMDQTIHTETERYERQTLEQVAFLLQSEGTEAVQFSSYPDTSQPAQPVRDPMTGQVMMQPQMLHDIVIRNTSPDQSLRFHVLPPERCKVSEKTPDHTLEHCDYFEYWEPKTISDVRQMGFQVSDDVAAQFDEDTQEDTARDRYEERLTDGPTEDPSMRRVKLRTIWIRHDTDGDGIAELQRVIRLGDEILHMEEETRIPVASIVPYIVTHRHVGLSLADITVDLQRIMTAILRQGLDNLYQSNNVRYLHTDKVDLDDLLASQPGGAVYVEGETTVGQVAPLQPPFLFPQAIAGLEYMDAVKEKRTGVNKTFSGVDENAIRQTATGISQLSTMAAQRVEQIARMFAPGIEYLFSVAHELILKHGSKKDVVKLRGKWVNIDPATWKTGRDMRVSVGFGAGNKDMLVARLANIWQMQTSQIALQSRIVDPKNLFETAQAIVKASDFTMNKFFTDPTTLPPPPPPPPTTDQVYAAVEQAKIKEDGRQSDNEILAKLALQENEVAGDTLIERIKGQERRALKEADGGQGQTG